VSVTVAIPVRDGGPRFLEVLRAVSEQRLDTEIELLVCDSGSSDGSPEAARAAGARVLSIAPSEFSHGGTRNLLMREARGSRVAFLTHDAVPASPGWLAALLSGFELADDVALVYGPYVPLPGASVPVARELREWFAGLAPDGAPRIDRLAEPERALAEPWRLGPQRVFFTDANGCVDRAAWERVPFRDVGHTEDQQLALDLLRAGLAKAFVPAAAVVHSHDYSPLEQLRRSFDEARGLRDVYGRVEPLELSAFRGHVTSRVKRDVRAMREAGAPIGRGILGSVLHHTSRWAGGLLGSRAERLPRALRARLSLERRA
jgi:glycosyltransferase involved in cell wall biosynthesis